MKPSVGAIVAAAVTVTGALFSNVAFGSTFTKNIPGAIRHPIHEGAKAVRVDDDPHHRSYRYHTYSTYHHVYHSTRVHHHRHRRH